MTTFRDMKPKHEKIKDNKFLLLGSNAIEISVYPYNTVWYQIPPMHYMSINEINIINENIKRPVGDDMVDPFPDLHFVMTG